MEASNTCMQPKKYAVHTSQMLLSQHCILQHSTGMEDAMSRPVTTPCQMYSCTPSLQGSTETLQENTPHEGLDIMGKVSVKGKMSGAAKRKLRYLPHQRLPGRSA